MVKVNEEMRCPACGNEDCCNADPIYICGDCDNEYDHEAEAEDCCEDENEE